MASHDLADFTSGDIGSGDMGSGDILGGDFSQSFTPQISEEAAFVELAQVTSYRGRSVRRCSTASRISEDSFEPESFARTNSRKQQEEHNSDPTPPQITVVAVEAVTPSVQTSSRPHE
jgi:hypothetical protein